MKRDMDLVRTILLTVESCENPQGMREVKFDEQPHEVVQHHLVLLREADLISGIVSTTSAGTNVYSAQLTWAGHEFLDAARSGTIWSKVKIKAKEKGLEFGQLPFGVLTEYLKQLIKDQLGLS